MPTSAPTWDETTDVAAPPAWDDTEEEKKQAAAAAEPTPRLEEIKPTPDDAFTALAALSRGSEALLKPGSAKETSIVSPEVAKVAADHITAPARLVGKVLGGDYQKFTEGMSQSVADNISGFSLESLASLPAFAVPGVAEIFVANVASKLPEQYGRIKEAVQQHGAFSTETAKAATDAGITDLMGFFALHGSPKARATFREGLQSDLISKSHETPNTNIQTDYARIQQEAGDQGSQQQQPPPAIQPAAEPQPPAAAEPVAAVVPGASEPAAAAEPSAATTAEPAPTAEQTSEAGATRTGLEDAQGTEAVAPPETPRQQAETEAEQRHFNSDEHRQAWTDYRAARLELQQFQDQRTEITPESRVESKRLRDKLRDAESKPGATTLAPPKDNPLSEVTAISRPDSEVGGVVDLSGATWGGPTNEFGTRLVKTPDGGAVWVKESNLHPSQIDALDANTKGKPASPPIIPPEAPTVPTEAPTVPTEPPTVPPEAPTVPPAELKAGDRFVASDGQEYQVHTSRYGVVKAHPVINGEPVVNADTTRSFTTTDKAAERRPELPKIGQPPPERGPGGRLLTPEAAAARMKRAPAPDGGYGEHPLVQFIRNDVGGIMSKSTALREWGKEKFAGNKSLWDSAPEFPDPRHNKIYSRTGGETPDKAANAAVEAGLLPEGSDASDLFQALQKVADASHRQAAVDRGTAAMEKETIRQGRAFTRAIAKPQKGEYAIKASDLDVGDKLKINGEPFKVKEIDPETFDVTMEDGSKYGIQRIEKDSVIYGEHAVSKTFLRSRAESRARQIKYQERYHNALLAAQDADAVEMRSPTHDNIRLLITREPSEPGKWRATRISNLDNEPLGHNVYATREDAMGDYLGQRIKGYGPPWGHDFAVTQIIRDGQRHIIKPPEPAKLTSEAGGVKGDVPKWEDTTFETPKGGEEVAKKPDTTTSGLPTEQGQPVKQAAASPAQTGDTRNAPTQAQETVTRTFPSYTTEQLRVMLANTTNPVTRGKIAVEIANRQSGASKVTVTPQIAPGFDPETGMPKLRAGEKGTGELLQGQDQPFNLAGETTIDTEKAAREAEQKAAQDRAAAAEAEKQQTTLFQKLGLGREDMNAIGIVPPGTARTGVLIDRARSMIQDLADNIRGHVIPRLTRAGVLDEATQHAAARQYVPALVEELLAKVFPDKYKDRVAMARTIDIIKKDNILGGFDAARLEYERAVKEDGQDSQRAKDQLAFVEAIANAQDLPQLSADVQASKGTDIEADIHRWEQHVSPLLDQLYNEMKGADPATPRETRGRYYSARMNLLTRENEASMYDFADPNKPMPEMAVSNYRNPNIKRDKFMRQATLTGDYSSDPVAVLTNSLAPRWNEVTKLRFYNALEKQGVARIVEGIDPTLKDMARLPIRYPETNPETGKTRIVERSLYVQRPLVNEIRNVLNTDGRPTVHPVFQAITGLQMAQLADASAHLKNIHSVVLNMLGRAGGTGADILRKIPGIGSADAVREIVNVSRDLSRDTPQGRAEVAFLAKNGMIRPEYPKTGLQQITRMQDLIHTVDTASRVIMNRRFSELVRRGWVKESMADRRAFVQQIGEYNRRLMNRNEVWLRDRGFSPFIVAGRTFNRFARRLATADPGFRPGNARAAATARAAQVAGLVFATTTPALINMFTTGSPFGRSGVPVGAIDFGPNYDTKEGKRRILDVFQLIGLRRGLRGLGIDAAIQGYRDGKTTDQIAGQAVSDIVSTAAHPFIGPGLGLTFQTITGKRLDLRSGYTGPEETRKLGGGKQYLENLRVGLKQANPFLYGVAQPAIEGVMQQAGVEPAQDRLGAGEQTMSGLIKSPLSAVGYKELYGGRSDDPIRDTLTLAQQFRKEAAKTDPKIAAEIARDQLSTFVSSDYRDLNRALAENNHDRALAEMEKLMTEKGKDPDVIAKYYDNLPDRSFTGSADLEENFVDSLSQEQRARYKAAVKLRDQYSLRAAKLLPEAERALRGKLKTRR